MLKERFYDYALPTVGRNVNHTAFKRIKENLSVDSCRYRQYSRGPQIFQKFRSYFHILCAGRVIYFKFRIEDLKSFIVIWRSMFSAYELLRIFKCKEKRSKCVY